MNIIGWICAIATGFAVVLGTFSIRQKTTWVKLGYGVFESVMYNGFSKLAWGFALGWVTFACVKGHGGIVNSFLSWGMFAPLARMTYLVYLMHIEFMVAFIFSLTYTIEYSVILMVTIKFTRSFYPFSNFPNNI